MALPCGIYGQREVNDLPLVDYSADVRSFCLHRGGIGYDSKSFFDIARLHGDLERCGGVDLNDHAGEFDNLEALRRNSDVVSAKDKIAEAVSARGAGNSVIYAVSFHTSCGYLGAGDSSARGIQNGSGDGAVIGLRVERKPCKDKQNSSSQEAPRCDDQQPHSSASTSSRYSKECREKTKGKKPRQGQIESHLTPKEAPTTAQTPILRLRPNLKQLLAFQAKHEILPTVRSPAKTRG